VLTTSIIRVLCNIPEDSHLQKQTQATYFHLPIQYGNIKTDLRKYTVSVWTEYTEFFCLGTGSSGRIFSKLMIKTVLQPSEKWHKISKQALTDICLHFYASYMTGQENTTKTKSKTGKDK
jgi:hypothetical protein